MPNLSLPFTQLIHENLSILMTFCFSRAPLVRLLDTEFQGEWKYLRKGLFDLTERRAERACLELAMFMRILDDEQDISGYLRGIRRNESFGRLVLHDESELPLKMRDVCNKIIHSTGFTWNLEDEKKPLLITRSRDTEKWKRAEIDIVALAAFCGGLIH